jgi:methyl-accepting chemotaxis protein
MSLLLSKSTFKLRISHKLPLFIVGAALVTALAIGIANYMSAAKEVEAAANEKLLALMESRRQALTNYLGSIEQDMRYTATSPYVYEALIAYQAAWAELGFQQTQTLQRLYIDDNPNPTGQKENLDMAPDGSTYSQVHGSYHPWFRQFLRERDYYDIFLFDLEGNLVYTVFKELDYATNLNNGEWKDSDLGNAFRAARDNPQTGSLQFFDFKPYAPSHGAAASFISTPIHGPDGSLAGVLVFQMPINRINAVMQISAGMGESGETYIVGADKLMRSDSRFSEESTILKTEVDGETVRLALAGKTGAQMVDDYRGISVLSGYGPIKFQGVTWAILAEIDTDEALAAVSDMRNQSLIIGGIVLAIVTMIGIFLARGIAHPLTKMNEAMRELAEGNKEIEIPAQGRADEIGDMAEAVQVFKDNMIKADALAAEQEMAQAEKQKRAQHIEKLTQDFDQSATGMLKTVSEAAS